MKKAPGKWKPGQSGNPAGRPRKAKNRINVREKMEQLNCDPFELLAYMATNNKEKLQITEDVSISQRAKCAIELAGYMAPKLKSVEVKQDDGGKEKRRTVVILPSNGRESSPRISLTDDDDDDDIDIAIDQGVNLIEAQDPSDDWDGQSEDR